MAATRSIHNGILRNHSLYFSTSCYRKQISLASLFQRYGFPSSQVPHFVSKNSFLLDSNIPELEKSLATLFSFRIPQNALVSLIRKCPAVLEPEFLQNWEQGLSKLKAMNPSSSMIVNFLECSRRFQLDPVEACKKVETLKGLGFSDDLVSKILEGFPSVIAVSKREIASVIEFLVEFGIPRDEVVDRVVRLYPKVLGIGVEQRLKPLIRELKELGFSVQEIRSEVIRVPRILGMEIGEFSQCLRLLEGLKCREAVKERIFQEGLLRACFEVKLRVDCLCGQCLTRSDALKLLWKEPRLITYDAESIKKKIRFLVQRMNYSVDCLLHVPEYLGVNFEKQIVPRYNVMEYLKAKEALGFEVGLKDMVKPSRLRFYNLYVKPYPECEKIYGRFSGTTKVKSKHPPGLWKLFKPHKFPTTYEDANNLKSFMDSLL
ncbi:hypothetical protein PIB30_074554 [Stylosanthes scabra]|uniref:Transcription termination factor MTERF15, mitochondrial n=1 Tax=Stylosanthes scabra TaxID=79078 RepID=A0ABU6TQE4_9FABA|nr:hypothetical protein [Stylosanthes scabra]